MKYCSTKYFNFIFKSDKQKQAVSGEVILEAVRQGMVAHVVFACNLRVFRTPNLGRDIEVLHGLTLKPRGPSQLLRKIIHLFRINFFTIFLENFIEFTKPYWKLIKTILGYQKVLFITRSIKGQLRVGWQIIL